MKRTPDEQMMVDNAACWLRFGGVCRDCEEAVDLMVYHRLIPDTSAPQVLLCPTHFERLEQVEREILLRQEGLE